MLIGAGEYHETVNITRAAPLTLLVRAQCQRLPTADFS